jgi:hypothetical protein
MEPEPIVVDVRFIAEDAGTRVEMPAAQTGAGPR